MGDSTRFYTQDGGPAYDADLRVAKREGYGVSVTSITRNWKKDGLDRWIQEQLLLSALTTDRTDDEDDRAFVARIQDDARAQSERAASIGTQTHVALAQCLTRQPISWDSIPAEVTGSLSVVADWVRAQQVDGAVEESFFHPLGYGGTRDLRGTMIDENSGDVIRCLIDWKTQAVKSANRDGSLSVKFYPEWAWQLAAYRLGTDIPLANCFSVVVSSNPELPGMKVKRWPAEHNSHASIAQATEVFLSLLQTWQTVHHFPCPLLDVHGNAGARNALLASPGEQAA